MTQAPNVDFVSVLSQKTVRSHIEKMFFVGRELLQESGFAIYRQEYDTTVSPLLIPKMRTTEDWSTAMYQAGSFDPIPLVRKEVLSRYWLSSDEQDNLGGEALAQLDEQASKESEAHKLGELAVNKINKIKSHPDLTEDEKEEIIDKIIDKDRQQNLGHNFRDDIFLLAHNHPQPAGAIAGYSPALQSNDLLIPSPNDLKSYEAIRKINPQLIELIVAASPVDQKAIVYATKFPNTPGNVALFESKTEGGGSFTKALGELSLAGYDYAILDLTPNARLTPEGKKQLREFQDRRAAKHQLA